MISNAYANHCLAHWTCSPTWDADTWMFVLIAALVVALVVWVVHSTRGED